MSPVWPEVGYLEYRRPANSSATLPNFHHADEPIPHPPPTKCTSRGLTTEVVLRPRSSEQGDTLAVGIVLGLTAVVTALVLIFCCYRTSRRRVESGRPPGFGIGAYFNDEWEVHRRDLRLEEPVPRRPRELKRFPDAWNPIWAMFSGYSHGWSYNNAARHYYQSSRVRGNRRVRRSHQRGGSICRPPRVYDRGNPPHPPSLYSGKSLDICGPPSIRDRRHSDDGGSLSGWREGQWYSASSPQSHSTPSSLCSPLDVCEPPPIGSPPPSPCSPPDSSSLSQSAIDGLRLSGSDGCYSTSSSENGSESIYSIESESILELPAPPPQPRSSDPAYISYTPSGIGPSGTLSSMSQNTRDLVSALSSDRSNYIPTSYSHQSSSPSQTSRSYSGSNSSLYTRTSRADTLSSHLQPSAYSPSSDLSGRNPATIGDSFSPGTWSSRSHYYSTTLSDIDPEVPSEIDSWADHRSMRNPSSRREFSASIVTDYGSNGHTHIRYLLFGLGGRNPFSESSSGNSSQSFNLTSEVASVQGNNEDFISDMASDVWNRLRTSSEDNADYIRESRQSLGRPVTMEDGSDDDNRR